jgi:hypothetical protein
MNDYMIYRLALKNGMKPPEKKKPNKIRQFSKKRQRANRKYTKKSRPIWVGKQCTIKAPGCTGMAQGIHHPKGKSSIVLLLDENNMMASCNHCNTWVEVHDKQAREMGLKKSRLKK